MSKSTTDSRVTTRDLLNRCLDGIDGVRDEMKSMAASFATTKAESKAERDADSERLTQAESVLGAIKADIAPILQQYRALVTVKGWLTDWKSIAVGLAAASAATAWLSGALGGAATAVAGAPPPSSATTTDPNSSAH